MPVAARWFRWIVGSVGIALVLIAALRIRITTPEQWTQLGVLALVSLLADLLLSIRISRQRMISFGATFTFATFLVFGAALASVVQIGALLCSQLLRRLDRRRAPHSWMFIFFNVGQLGVCGLLSGAAVWLLLDQGLYEPPSETLRAILVYALTYLALNIALTSVAVWLRYGWNEVRETLWPNVSLWTAINFALSIPITLFIVNLGSSLGFAADVVLTFSFLAIISYIVRINLRYRAINRDLQIINDISHALATTLELDRLFPALYERVRQIMPVDVFLIGLANGDQTELSVPFIIEDGERLAPRTLALEGTLATQVLRTKRTLYEPDLPISAGQQRFGRSDRHSATVTFVPLYLPDKVIGVLSAQSYQPNMYTPQQLNLLTSIGQIAAVAINNAQLYAREKEVMRSREEFVSLVAHELKNPLAALLGHSQILERRTRHADEKLRRTVHVVIEQGERMNRLVEDLLDISRADAGRLSLHTQRLDLQSLIKNVVEQQQSLATAHRFDIEAQESLPVIVGDVMRLTQVLQNLLNNAVKYSPSGGTIKISLSARAADDPIWPNRTQPIRESAPCWALVQVQDSGIGIPEDQLRRIFDRFFRANNVTQTEIGGAGLGLSVCESLVRAHGGFIWAESIWGVGSTFSFALPVPE